MASSELTTPCLQLITGESDFDPDPDQGVASFLSDAGFEPAQAGSAHFYSVGIIGAQSSGKSTLLNALFGTTFDVLDKKRHGHQQTTRGIWVAPSKLVTDALLLDVEGTDNAKRSDDTDNFERRTALFALAVAEVLIVNLWSQDIGRYGASNLPVIKTMFEVNLKLFKHDQTHRTTLLFVVRDYAVEADATTDKLAGIIREQLADIWSKMDKPRGSLQDASFSDFFDIQFAFLPNFVYARDAFNTAIEGLRERFRTPETEGFLFEKKALHYAKSVPVSGFDKFLRDLWVAVESHGDLNLPSQREMLAVFKCDEATQTVLTAFRGPEGLAPLAKRIQTDKHFVPQFASEGAKLIEVAVDAFDGLVQAYMDKVVSAKRATLLATLRGELEKLWLGLAEIARKSAVADFAERLGAKLPKSTEAQPCAPANFHKLVDAERKAVTAQFEERLRSALVSDCEWPVQEALDALHAELATRIASLREKALAQLDAEAREVTRTELQPVVSHALVKGSNALWKEIRAGRVKAWKAAAKLLGAKLPGLQATKTETEAAQTAAKACGLAVVRDECSKLTSMLPDRLRARFDTVFAKTDDGLPRRWQGVTVEQAREQFRAAVDSARGLLGVFNTFDNRDDDDDEKLPAPAPKDRQLMGDVQAENLFANFERQVEGALHEVQESIERRHAQSQLPIWAWVLIVILGWDNAATILYAPTSFFATVIFAAMVMMVAYSPFAQPIFATAKSYANTYAAEAWKFVTPQDPGGATKGKAKTN